MLETYGVLQTFFIFGMAFLVALVLTSLPMRFPPADWRPEGWQGAARAGGESSFTAGDMLKTSSCLGLWLCFIIGSLSGLMAIGISSNVGQEVIKLKPATAAGLVSFFALFNGGGRPLFGWLTDAIGHSKAAALSLLMIALASAGMLFAEEGSAVLYAACFAAFWMGLGAWLAIAPTATAAYFGTKNYATNYGFIFSAYGIGAIAASLTAGFAKDIFGSYIRAFHISGSLATLGIVIALTLMKKPVPARATPVGDHAADRQPGAPVARTHKPTVPVATGLRVIRRSGAVRFSDPAVRIESIGRLFDAWSGRPSVTAADPTTSPRQTLPTGPSG